MSSSKGDANAVVLEAIGDRFWASSSIQKLSDSLEGLSCREIEVSLRSLVENGTLCRRELPECLQKNDQGCSSPSYIYWKPSAFNRELSPPNQQAQLGRPLTTPQKGLPRRRSTLAGPSAKRPFKSPVLNRSQPVERMSYQQSRSDEKASPSQLECLPPAPRQDEAYCSSPSHVHMPSLPTTNVEGQRPLDDRCQMLSSKGSILSPLSSQSNNRSLLLAEQRRVTAAIAEQEETLRKLKMVRFYRSKNEQEPLADLIVRWRQAGQEAAEELLAELPDPRPNMGELLRHLNIDPTLLHYNEEEEGFL